jgi:cytochrome c oxidase subunit 2
MKNFLTIPRILLLVAAALIFCGGLPLHPNVSAQTEIRNIDLTAKRFNFDPGEITVKKGQPVKLTIKSLDTNHGLRVPELGIDMKIKKGATAEAEFTPDKTGDFVGHCTVFCGSGHGSMKLTIHVVE